jgi:hypothetical protein
MLVTFSLPGFNIKKKCLIPGNFMWMNILSHQAHLILLLPINSDLLGELGIIMNFNDQTVPWDTDTIPMKDRDMYSIISKGPANEPHTLRDEYSWAKRALMLSLSMYMQTKMMSTRHVKISM